MSIQELVQPTDSNLAKQIPLGILGAVLGAVVGFFLFQFLIRRGLYFIVLPGALVGFGCGLAARNRSLVLAFIAFAIAIQFQQPFLANGSQTPTFVTMARH